MRVLVVDGEPNNRARLRSLLQAHGYEVAEANDGLAALDILHSEQVDLIASDWNLARMSGCQLWHACTESPTLARIPFLFVNVSEVLAEPDDSRGYTGVVRYVNGPVGAAAFIELVQSELARRSADALPAQNARPQTDLTRRYLDLFLCTSVPQLLLHDDASGSVADVNPACARLLGRERETLLGLGVAELGLLRPADAAAALESLRQQGTYESGSMLLTSSSSNLELELTGRAFPSDAGRFMHVIVRDVSQHRRSLSTLRQRAAMERFVTSLSTRLVSANQAELNQELEAALSELATFAGTERAALYRWSQETNQLVCTHEWHAQDVAVIDPGSTMDLNALTWLAERLRAGRITYVRARSELPKQAASELALIERLGIESFLCLPLLYAGALFGLVTIASAHAGSPMQDDDVILLGTVADVFTTTLARRRYERMLERTNRALQVVNACNTALIHASDEQQLLQDICRVIVEVGGYRAAYAHCTESLHSPEGIDASYGERAASRDDTPGTFSLDLVKDTRPIGKLIIDPKGRDVPVRSELQLLEKLAAEVSFGLVALRTRAERDRIARERHDSDLRLRGSLEDAIQAIAAMLESRDPYTAGHQRRVALLCVAIARKLGLSEDRIHGLRLAATIHDVGKIQVPTDILNRPGRLTPIEFELVKCHPRVGRDIVKDVKLPWAIADIIWQHHEHLDGSGYPQGLKGGDIPLESRILTVADVAEAMASHRPYRASLGIGPAIAELHNHSGSFYDPEAVEACVQILRESGVPSDLPPPLGDSFGNGSAVATPQS